MSFLERFKGKTQILKKYQVGQILGQTNSSTKNKLNKNQLVLLKLSQSPQVRQRSSIFQSNLIKKKALNQKQYLQKDNNQKSGKSIKSKSTFLTQKVIQNPFLVQNDFFLDEQQHKVILKLRKQGQIRERIQKQRKKREQIQQKVIKSIRNSPQIHKKTEKKRQIKLQGLGPNVGGEQWNKKKTLKEKMMKFSEEIKKINMHRIQDTNNDNTNFKLNKSISQKSKPKQIDPRTMGIKYSKSIQKPTFYTLQKSRQNKNEAMRYSPNFQSHATFTVSSNITRQQQIVADPEQNEFSNLILEINYSQLQKINNRHKQFKDKQLKNKQFKSLINQKYY